MGVGKGVVGGQWKLFNCDDRQNVRALSSCRANKPTLRIRGRAQSDGERMSPTSGIGSPPDVGDDFPTWPTSPGKQSGDAWLLLAGFVSPGPERSTADLQNVPFPRQWQVCSPVKQSPLTASTESNVIMEPATDRDMETAQETRSSNGETDRGDEAGHQALNGHSKPNDSQAPVIIVGAGPVGLLLALRLAQKNIGSIVLDKDSAPSQLPRAIGYYGPVHDVFQEMGLYDQIADEGMPSGGYVWRKAPVDVLDENGSVVGKELGPILGENMMSQPGPEGKYKLGHYSIQLPQCRLAEIFLQEAAKTGLVKVLWDHKVAAVAQSESDVSVTVATNEGLATFTGQYLAACDGGKSTIRKLLGIRLVGHSWPERFLATDILRTAPVIPKVPVHFTVDEKFWGVATPLERVEAGKRGLWRYSLAVPAKPTDDPDCVPLTDEQVLEPEYVDSLLLRQVDGPRPSDHVVVRKSLYKMHQLLATTMHRGRCFLAGDAAHINNPIGGLGLCTGLLDADALSQTLEIAVSAKAAEDRSSAAPDALQQLFTRYSTERRWVFQNIIHPFSSANKTRLHGGNPDEVAREDWYFVALARGNKQELQAIHRPLYASWRTNMWQFWQTSSAD